MYDLHLTHSWQGGSACVQCVIDINPINSGVLCNDSLPIVAGKSSPVYIMTLFEKNNMQDDCLILRSREIRQV